VASDDAVYETRTFPGIRWFPALGIRGGGTNWSGTAAEVQEYYDRFAASRESRWLLTTPRNWFVVEKKIPWEKFFVDQTIAPSSHEQARDPNWSNYRWNQVDILASMLTAPAIVEDKAKLSIFVAMTATSEQEPVPQWMINKGLTWRESSGHVHVRQDREEGWRWMADFPVAVLRRYG